MLLDSSGRLYLALRRAMKYRNQYGWRRFVGRLARIWVWLPRLIHRPRRPSRLAESAERRPQLASVPFGVNIMGYITGTGSLAEAARLAAEAFQAAGVRTSLNDHMLKDARDRQMLDLAFSEANPFRANLMISGPNPAEAFSWKLRPDHRSGRYSIGFWPWEYQNFPAAWQGHFHEYDEVWAPSSFVVESLTRSAPVPVILIPHPVRTRPLAEWPRSPFLSDLPDDAFIFLFVFSYSGFLRKNPIAAIEAFARAFSPGENAWFVIKSEFGAGRGDLAALQRVAQGRNVLILDAFFTREQIDGLFASCDCYVSLHHAEGFGLTLAEAMAFGKPGIATNYSGNLDFMSRQNSFLVEYRLVPARDSRNAETKGQLWAEPSIDDAARYMRYVYDHRDEARAVGERGRVDVQRQLSLEAVGMLMRQRLLEVIGD